MSTGPRATVTHSQPTHISVAFKIVSSDQLRMIIFTLSRMSDAANDSWGIMFELDERADVTQNFGMVIQLQADVDHDDNDKAAATANHGMDADQHAQVLVAADTAKDAKNGDATLADAQEDAKAVVAARNASSPG